MLRRRSPSRPAVSARVVAVTCGVLVVVAAGAAGLWHGANRGASGAGFTLYWPLLVVGGIAYAATGSWLAAAHPRLRVGWLLLGVGASLALPALTAEYAVASTHRGAGWPLVPLALWLGSWLWAAGYLVVGLVLPLVLPDGRLGSRRELPLLALAIAMVLVNSVIFAVTPYDEQAPPIELGGLTNPVGVEGVTAAWVVVPAAVLTVLSLAAGLAVLVRRSWRAPTERAATAWIVLGVLATVVLGLAAFLVPTTWDPWIAAAATLPLPLSCLVAVLRHQMWQVEVVLSRSLAYTALSAAAIAAYVAVVGVLGGVLGSTTGVPVLATALVAVLVVPAHVRVQHLVNRLVYGEVESPDVLLTRLADRLGDNRDPAEVAARLLPEVVARTQQVLRVPYVAVHADAVGLVVAGDPPDEPADELPLVYAGAEVGRLVIGGWPHGRGRRERRLVETLVGPLATAVHAAGLAEELRRSRERLVSGREEERRRLHRELHDGVGPALAAAALQVETARDLADRDLPAAQDLLDRTVARLRGTVDDVRAVVHGLRPQPLDDLGLAAALEELGARFTGTGLTVQVDVGNLPARSAAADVATYLVASEALANSVRHGDPCRVDVSLGLSGGWLVLTVDDDGPGLPDPVRPGVGLASMRERADELGGTLVVGPGAAGAGTCVELRLPVEGR